MSIGSLLLNASRQMDEARFDGARAKHAAKLASIESLTRSVAASGADDAEEKAKSLFETFKDSVEISSNLERAAKDNQATQRKQKATQIEERIKQLKELLRFATPEQAKRMLKELKQLAKEFKAVAKDLGSASSDANAGPSGGGSTTQGINGVQNPTGIQNVSSIAASPSATDRLEPPASKAAAAPLRTPLTIGETATAGAAGATRSTGDGNVNDGTQGAIDSEIGEDVSEQAGWQAELSNAIQTYAKNQSGIEQAHEISQKSSRQDEKEALKKIAADLKYLADAIARLLKDEDDDFKKGLKGTQEDIEAGLEILNKEPNGGSVSAIAAGAPVSISLAGVDSVASTDLLV